MNFLHKIFFFKKKAKIKMVILLSGRQTYYYLDIFPLIVHLSRTKMHFLSKI